MIVVDRGAAFAAADAAVLPGEFLRNVIRAVHDDVAVARVRVRRLEAVELQGIAVGALIGLNASIDSEGRRLGARNIREDVGVAVLGCTLRPAPCAQR